MGHVLPEVANVFWQKIMANLANARRTRGGVGSGQLAHALSVRIAQVPLAHGAPRAFGARRRRLPCPARGLLRPVNGFEELNRVTRKTSSSCERPITFHFSAFCIGMSRISFDSNELFLRGQAEVTVRNR